MLRTWHKACDISVRTKDDEWVVTCIRLSSKVPIAHISEHNKFLRAVQLQFSLDNKMEVPDTQLVKVGDRVVLRSREPDQSGIILRSACRTATRVKVSRLRQDSTPSI